MYVWLVFELLLVEVGVEVVVVVINGVMELMIW